MDVHGFFGVFDHLVCVVGGLSVHFGVLLDVSEFLFLGWFLIIVGDFWAFVVFVGFNILFRVLSKGELEWMFMVFLMCSIISCIH